MKKIPIRNIVTPQPETPPAERFRIRDLKQLLNGKELVQELHRHDFFFILALQKGAGTHEIDFTPYKIHDNSIFILRPGQVHQLSLKSTCTGYLLEFGKDFYHPADQLARQRLIKAGNKNFCEFENSRFKKIHSILFSIYQEFNNKQEGYLEIIKANLEIFFIEFIRQSSNPAGNTKIVSTFSQERLEEFMTLLETHIANKKQASQYAGLLNLSLYQLNTITKTTVGKQASVLISEQIILEAKRFLLATPNQVKDIADQLGYEDISYFIRFFKKHTGLSPEAFRKKFK